MYSGQFIWRDLTYFINKMPDITDDFVLSQNITIDAWKYLLSFN